MNTSELVKKWNHKKGRVFFNDDSFCEGSLLFTNPADNDEETEGDSIFIQIWQDSSIIEEPIEDIKNIEAL